MTICKYFLDGRCRYGERCRFDHPRGGQNQGVQRQLFGGEAPGGGGGGQRVSFRDSFGTSQNTSQYKWTAQANKQQKAPVGTPSADLVNTLQKEVEIWDQSKQWPFSCLSIERDLPCVPDFEDLSPEELRFEAYTAMKSGNLQTYVNKFQQLSQEYSNKRQQLKSTNPQLRQKLIQFIDEQRNSKAAGLQSSSFGVASSGGFEGGSGGGSFGAGAGGVFGSTGSTTNTFGQSSSSSSIFGGGSSGSGNLFGKAPESTSSGLFGQGGTGTSAIASGPSTSVFGGGATSGSFGGAGGAGGTFGGSGSSAFGSSGTQSGFGSTGTSTGFGSAGSSGGFGSGGFSAGVATGGFGGGSTGTTGGFGGGSTGTAGGVFGGSGFGGATKTTIFGGNSGTTSAFTSTPGMTSGFGSQPPQTVGPPSGFFSGQTQSTPVAATPIPTPANSKMYTPMADLTEEEKAQFSAPSFVLGKIPTRPPPRELINGSSAR